MQLESMLARLLLLLGSARGWCAVAWCSSCGLRWLLRVVGRESERIDRSLLLCSARDRSSPTASFWRGRQIALALLSLLLPRCLLADLCPLFPSLRTDFPLHRAAMATTDASAAAAAERELFGEDDDTQTTTQQPTQTATAEDTQMDSAEATPAAEAAAAAAPAAAAAADSAAASAAAPSSDTQAATQSLEVDLFGEDDDDTAAAAPAIVKTEPAASAASSLPADSQAELSKLFDDEEIDEDMEKDIKKQLAAEEVREEAMQCKEEDREPVRLWMLTLSVLLLSVARPPASVRKRRSVARSARMLIPRATRN